MALKDQRKQLISYIGAHKEYLQRNADLFQVHEGNLLPYVEKEMEKAFSPEYFDRIKGRIMPINILKRFIDKVSKAYVNDPTRTASAEGLQETVETYEDLLEVNTNGEQADRWANLFKGFAWELYLDEDTPALRTIPFDRFLVWSDNKNNPMKVTGFIKFMGKCTVAAKGVNKTKEVDVYYAYTDEEFDAFTEDGDDYSNDEIQEIAGVNPYGTIPFVYDVRSSCELIPTQDTDLMPITKIIPILASDLSGAIMFQCFSIVYGIDVKAENLTLSPNAFWNLKGDEGTDSKPVVGTIKPEVDIEKVVSFITTMFAFWVETKGIKVGSVGQVDAGNSSSGIAKILDEMDTFEIRKTNIKFFKKAERQLWEKVKLLNNYWVSSGLLSKDLKLGVLPDDFKVKVEFDEPQPAKSRKELIDELKGERDLEAITPKEIIQALRPDWDEGMVDKVVAFYEGRRKEDMAAKAKQFPIEEVAA